MEEKEKFNQSKYNYQFAQENYYRLTVLLPKNQKDKIKAHAAKCGDGSINAFVNRAIAEAMERDTARLDAQQAAELEALAHAHKLRAVFLPRAHCLRFRRRSFCAIIIYIAVVYYISLNILYAII